MMSRDLTVAIRRQNRFSATLLTTLTLALLLSAANANTAAAQVQWLPAGDGLWQDPANWSSNPSLPGVADDVVIDQGPIGLTVTMSAGNQQINSLTMTENLDIQSGALIVNDPSLISGTLNIASGGALQAQGGTTTFTASGPVDLSGSVRALAGADIALPATRFQAPATNPSFYEPELKADGFGSSLDLATITTITSSTNSFSIINVRALAAGQVDLTGVTSFDTGAIAFQADGVASLVDITNLTTLTPTVPFGEKSLIKATGGGEVRTPNLTTVHNVNIETDAFSTVSTGQITALTFSQVTANGSTPALTNAANIDGSAFIARNGGKISTPAATTYDAPGNPGFFKPNWQAEGVNSELDLSSLTDVKNTLNAFGHIFVTANTGGKVNLTGLTGFTTGAISFKADGVTSLVDLSNMTSFTPSNVFGEESTIEAANGGEVRIPNLTVIDRTYLRLNPLGVIQTSQITDFTRSIAFVNQTTPDFSSMTNIDQSGFVLTNGAKLTTAATSFQSIGDPNSVQPNWFATGATTQLDLSSLTLVENSSGAFSRIWAKAEDGGRVDLSGLTTFTKGALILEAIGSGAVLDVSNLATFTPTNTFGERSRIKADAGGLVKLPANALITNADLILTNSGQIQTDAIQIDPGSELKGEGTLIADVVANALINPGLNTRATIEVDGSLQLGSLAKLRIELESPSTNGAALAAAAVGVFDQITATGPVSLDGELQLLFVGGDTPTLGDFFEIVSADLGVTGSFNTLNLPTLPEQNGVQLEWLIDYQPTTVTAHIVPEPAVLLVLTLGGAAAACRRRP